MIELPGLFFQKLLLESVKLGETAISWWLNSYEDKGRWKVARRTSIEYKSSTMHHSSVSQHCLSELRTQRKLTTLVRGLKAQMAYIEGQKMSLAESLTFRNT